MMKLSLYVFLLLIWCNVGFAEKISIECDITDGDKVVPIESWTVNTDNVGSDNTSLYYVDEKLFRLNTFYMDIQNNIYVIKLWNIDRTTGKGTYDFSKNISIEMIGIFIEKTEGKNNFYPYMPEIEESGLMNCRVDKIMESNLNKQADTLPTYEFSEFERKYLEENFYNIDPNNRFYPNDFPNAMIALGWNYFIGISGFEQNNEKAILWSKRASDLGWSIASSNLGLFYYAGLAGVEQNLSKAHHYYLLAAEQWDNSITKESESYSPENLIKEMNQYNPNPTKEFARLRDLYFDAIKDKTKKKIVNLRNFSSKE